MKQIFETLIINVRSIIGLAVVLFAFGFLYALLFWAIPAENKDVIQIASGIVLGVLSAVTGYYFGSSKDKSDGEKAAIIKEEKTT